MCWRVTHATQVRIIEDQQAAKRREFASGSFSF